MSSLCRQLCLMITMVIGVGCNGGSSGPPPPSPADFDAVSRALAMLNDEMAHRRGAKAEALLTKDFPQPTPLIIDAFVFKSQAGNTYLAVPYITTTYVGGVLVVIRERDNVQIALGRVQPRERRHRAVQTALIDDEHWGQYASGSVSEVIGDYVRIAIDGWESNTVKVRDRIADSIAD